MKKRFTLFTCLALILTILVSVSGSAFAASEESYKKLYKQVVDEYRVYIGTKGQVETPIIKQSAQFKTLGSEGTGIFYPISQNFVDCVYDLKDINSDGIPELFIQTQKNSTKKGSFGAVYTIVEGEPTLLYSTVEATNALYLTTGKNVIMTGVGTDDNENKITTISSNKYAKGESTQTVRYDWDITSERYTSTDADGKTEEIQKEDYEKALDSLTGSYYKFSWTDLADYTTEELPDEETPDTDETDKPSTDKPEEDTPAEVKTVKIYRLYNTITGEHLYTSDENEATVLSRQADWTHEGVGWTAPETGTPVYRLYSPVTGVHLFTTDKNEVSVLAQSGWSIDNDKEPLFYSGGKKSVYRLYNPVLRMHLITTDTNEYRVLGTQGWNQEGVKLKAQ